MTPQQIRDALDRLREHDLPTHGGRTLAYVFDSGLPEVDETARAALGAYSATNGLDPTAFPSLLTMENELVGTAADLLDAPGEAVGTFTSGGTESILLAVQTARDARPEVARPNMVLPTTAHAAFHKAAHYFGVRTVPVDVDDTYRADVTAAAAAVDEETVLMVASAPSYAHGVVDPVEDLAALAEARGVRCHVDACIGGWVLPYAARAGRDVPAWSFAVPGVTSISVDLHKYGYTPKGASLLLHRSPRLRRAQFFAHAAWPGYTMLNSTTQSTKSGGPLAAAWAVVRTIGDDGYRRLAEQVLEGVDRLVAGVEAIPQLSVVTRPDSTLVALRTDDSCDPFTLADEMGSAGWFIQPQMSFAGQGPTLHLSLSAATAPHVEDLLTAMRAAVTAAVTAGPVQVAPDLAELVLGLDHTSLDEQDFETLLAATGMTGGAGLPDRMAPVNALLDLAPPPLRESLMVAFLDRLSRPTR